jgi:hypothetical protein
MMETYDNIIGYIEELVAFLKTNGIEAEYKSHLENDYLLAHQFYEEYKNDPAAKQNEEGRAALGGLFELYKWIWSVKDCKEFHKLTEHLKLLVEASPKINSITPMMSPVTGKQDDKSNKFIEAIIGMYAVKIGENVDLDDPIKSSGGTNPDVLFDYKGKRVSFACKTLRGNSEDTILDNMRSAAKQIERAKCDFGYIVFNAMNILDHDKIKNNIYQEHIEPLNLIWQNLDSRYKYLRNNAEEDVLGVFSGSKTRSVIVTFVHSVTRIASPIGNLSTSLKATFATDFQIPGINTQNDIELLSGVNEFIHNRI